MCGKTSENQVRKNRIHMTVMRVMVVLAMGIIILSGVSVSDAAMRKEVTTSKTGLPEAGNFNVIAEPFEWGKDVTRLIINTGSVLNKDDIIAGDINVTARHYSEQAYTDDTKGTRKVLDAYPVDSEGNKVDESEYIVVDLEYGKGVQAAHLGSYNYASYYTPLKPYYEVNWSLAGELKQAGVADLVCDEFELARHTDTSIADARYNFVDYAFYAPKADGTKKPLIIFFHGMGEGGARDLNNKGVQMYAYQEEYFAEKEVQDIMGGSAYVLLPQSPDRWPTDGFENETKYLDVVKSLVDTIISDNKDIDTNRIYIGGLSMGGFMACRMIINFPDMFAAAFPCSQAYAITKEDAPILKELPIWISCSEVDGTCRMDPYTYTSYLNIIDAGNTKARCCVMESCQQNPACTFRFYTPDSNEATVYEIACDEGKENKKTGDLTWNNDTYGGHEAGWILLFNNKEYYMDGDNKVSVMEWVASQSLVESISLDTSKVKVNYNAGEAFTADGLVVNAVMRDGSTVNNVADYTVTAADTTKAGTYKVTVSYSGKSAAYDITVAGSNTAATSAPSPSAQAAPSADVKVSLSESSVKLCKKGFNKYTVTAKVTGSSEKVAWTSSDEKVAVVSEKGVITAKSAGKAVIKATVAGVSAECKVTVKNATFKIAKKSITVKKGKKIKIKVTVSPKKKVTYKTSSKKIAKVNTKGVVKGIKKGTATITVTYQGVKQVIKVKVK